MLVLGRGDLYREFQHNILNVTVGAHWVPRQHGGGGGPLWPSVRTSVCRVYGEDKAKLGLRSQGLMR